MKSTIGRYLVEKKLGEGGMGVVYAARDERLGRSVAIKTLRDRTLDASARERLWREARAGAAVNHPNVCHVYEVGEDDSGLFIVMELLAGEPLSARIEREALPLAEVLAVARGMLAALEALHGHGLVHRDLKPANVFLTPHGVKLLDFGLVREQIAGEVAGQVGSDAGSGAGTVAPLTQSGTVLGTPHYMSPEQLEGRPATARSDIFAFGAILFEMLVGRPAFAGDTIWEVAHAILHDQPPALVGAPGTILLDRTIRRCLAKPPEERFADAAAVTRELAGLHTSFDNVPPAAVRAATRLIVLPFRMLKPDPDVDFLSFSLPDAIAASLTGLGPLVVRSTLVARQYSGDTLDLKRLSAEAEVDAAVTGSILRAGSTVRVAAQLVEVPTGTIQWSRTAQLPLGDIFQLQDDLVKQILESLRIPLTARENGVLTRDVPATSRAYELYLRANDLASSVNSGRLMGARELYRASLAEDPRYAPAWARIGRVHRVLAKFGNTDYAAGMRDAADAFAQALSLNPDLAIAHSLYTHFEVEELGQGLRAVRRLVGRLAQGATEPEIFVGLVVACRYCGLLDASIAAHSRAMRLDPTSRTSAQYTFDVLQNWEESFRLGSPAKALTSIRALLRLGRRDEAVRWLEQSENDYGPVGVTFAKMVRAQVFGHRDDTLSAAEALYTSNFKDPEGILGVAVAFAEIGEDDRALDALDRVVDGGYHCPAIAAFPEFERLRGYERFAAAIAKAEAGHREAAAAFVEMGGPRLLGMDA
jgi:eukaryotic-like serine/threonine-protein kinase